jgi:type II secretory pathway component PulJ
MFMGENRFKEAGFSLIEVMVSFVLLIILLAPLLSFMRAGQISRSTSLRLADIEQNARAAMSSLSRDLQNAGYNFTSQISLGNSKMLSTLTGNPPDPSNFITPITPGNNLNLVRTINSSGATVTNETDQITMVFVDQNFNNGLPLSGNIPPSGNEYRSLAAVDGLYEGDFVVLIQGATFAVGSVSSVSADGTIISFKNDPNGLNNSPLGPSVFRGVSQTRGSIGLYKFLLISYFVDGNGNLIRREQLAPPHTLRGGNNSISPPVTITPNITTYTCASTSNCFIDNIIATGVEDLQFTYNLADPSSTGVTGPVDDPGYHGRAANLGTSPVYRLLDIRQVNVSIKIRALERDTKLKDPYNKKQGYLYRFTLEGTYNTRNFYGSDFRQ